MVAVVKGIEKKDATLSLRLNLGSQTLHNLTTEGPPSEIVRGISLVYVDMWCTKIVKA